MRMPAYFAASVGLAIAHAPQPVVRFVESPEPLSVEAAWAISDGAVESFAARWPSRAPQAFSFNGATFFVLLCDTPGAIPTPPAPPRFAMELERLLRVSPESAPVDPGR
jgi:hypothetical protein